MTFDRRPYRRDTATKEALIFAPTVPTPGADPLLRLAREVESSRFARRIRSTTGRASISFLANSASCVGGPTTKTRMIFVPGAPCSIGFVGLTKIDDIMLHANLQR